MDNHFLTLITSAAAVGFLHTLLGPDHYIPFIAISKARQWTIRKTAWITAICGLAHVVSSFFIGLVGIRLSYHVTRLEAFEALRGSFTGWLIMAFGLTYLVWGIKKIIGSKKQNSLYQKLEDNTTGTDNIKPYKQLLPWVLFIVFIFGPCEPLIPVLMFPAANVNLMSLIMVAGIFGIVTIATMQVLVLLPLLGIQKVHIRGMKTYGNALAGILILLCGLGIQFFGL